MVKKKYVTTLSEMKGKVLYALTSSQGIWVFYPLSFAFFFHLFVCAVRVAGEGGGDAGAAGTHQLLKGRASLFWGSSSLKILLCSLFCNEGAQLSPDSKSFSLFI